MRSLSPWAWRVDNAIVVVDGILIRLQKGEAAEPAASAVVKQSAWPMLGATIIAILAFAAIGTSDDSTGGVLSIFVPGGYGVVTT